MKRKIASIDSNVLENEENFNFVEEIPENQVKEPDYLDEKDHKRRNILVLIIILLSLFLFGFGLYYAFIRPNNQSIAKLDEGDLLIVHPYVDFGLTIDSFFAHNSEKNAVKYNFYVENGNDVNVTYKLKINSKKIIGADILEDSSINFALFKNGVQVSNGNLFNVNQILVRTKILKHSKDNFELKLWSAYKTNKSYGFEIEIID